MKLATLRPTTGTAAVRVNADDATATVIDGHSDLSSLLAQPDWREIAEGADGPTGKPSRSASMAWARSITPRS